MYYIQESDKPNKILQIFNIIKLQGNRIILPINNQKSTLHQINKLAKKTNYILKNANSNKVVISKEIQKHEQYINFLNTYNIEIIDGRWIFEVMANEVLEYIINLKKIKKQETQISILVNNLSEMSIENIRMLVKEYKRVNIITNHIEKLRKIERHILDEYGILITVANNKKKSLSKSEIILNIDFPNELINKYNIYDNAIIININGNIKIKKKRFNGIVINDYEISLKKINDYNIEKTEKFKTKEIYEAEFYKKQNIKSIREKIKRDGVKIEYLIGNNGIINQLT